jgi:DNA polymerase-3 subunit gamma/tau
VAPEADAAPATASLPRSADAWPPFVAGLKLSGIAGQLAAQSALVRCEGRMLTLAVPATHKHLVDPTYADRLRAALEQATGQKLKLAFEVADAAPASLAAQVSRERAEQKAAAEAAFRDEPFVRDLITRFDATIKPDSIKPVS